MARRGEQRGSGHSANGLRGIKTESVHAAASEEQVSSHTHARVSAVYKCALGLRLHSLVSFIWLRGRKKGILYFRFSGGFTVSVCSQALSPNQSQLGRNIPGTSAACQVRIPSVGCEGRGEGVGAGRRTRACFLRVNKNFLSVCSLLCTLKPRYMDRAEPSSFLHNYGGLEETMHK